MKKINLMLILGIAFASNTPAFGQSKKMEVLLNEGSDQTAREVAASAANAGAIGAEVVRDSNGKVEKVIVNFNESVDNQGLDNAIDKISDNPGVATVIKYPEVVFPIGDLNLGNLFDDQVSGIIASGTELSTPLEVSGVKMKLYAANSISAILNLYVGEQNLELGTPAIEGKSLILDTAPGTVLSGYSAKYTSLYFNAQDQYLSSISKATLSVDFKVTARDANLGHAGRLYVNCSANLIFTGASNGFWYKEQNGSQTPLAIPGDHAINIHQAFDNGNLTVMVTDIETGYQLQLCSSSVSPQTGGLSISTNSWLDLAFMYDNIKAVIYSGQLLE